jgi:hypothetical protein
MCRIRQVTLRLSGPRGPLIHALNAAAWPRQRSGSRDRLLGLAASAVGVRRPGCLPATSATEGSPPPEPISWPHPRLGSRPPEPGQLATSAPRVQAVRANQLATSAVGA